MNIKILLLCSFAKLIFCSKPCAVKPVIPPVSYELLGKAYVGSSLTKDTEDNLYKSPQRVSLAEHLAQSYPAYEPSYEAGPPPVYNHHLYEAVPIVKYQLPEQSMPEYQEQKPSYPVALPQYHPYPYFVNPAYPNHPEEYSMPATDSCQDGKATLPEPMPVTPPYSQPCFQGK